MSNSDIERERFEDWYVGHYKNLADDVLVRISAKGMYRDMHIQACWMGWKAKNQDIGKCEWATDSEGLISTSCGGYFELNEGTPEENKFKFCCYCGGILKQKLFELPKEQS